MRRETGDGRGKRQEARGKRQEARGKRQEARGKRQEAKGKRGDGRRETGEAIAIVGTGPCACPKIQDGRRETGDGRRETGDGRRETGEAIAIVGTGPCACPKIQDGRRETGDGRSNRRDRPPCLSAHPAAKRSAVNPAPQPKDEREDERREARGGRREREDGRREAGETIAIVGTGPCAICTNSFIIGIALVFHRPSEKPSPNMPSQKSINESHHAQRASPSRNPHPFCNPLCRLSHVVLLQKRFALCLAPRRMRAAFLNGSGSCTPLAYFSSDAYSRLLC